MNNFILENLHYNNVSFNKTRSLKKIVNVYQEKYANRLAQGLGDYLRGCYCLYQICKNIGVEFEMNLKNHPMSKFLNNNDTQYPQQFYNNTQHFGEVNYIHTENGIMKREKDFYGKIIRYLNENRNIYDNALLMGCNSFPVWNTITHNARNYVKSKLTPNEDMNKYISSTLTELGLKEKEYGVIHIRCGDKFMNSTNNEDPLLNNNIERILNVIKSNTNGSKKYILLSDSVVLKKKLDNIPNIIVYLKKITHLGENFQKTDEGIKNTLLDFFIMSKANSILSISKYAWGSGFSEWCAVTYGIPFQKKLILDESISGRLKGMNIMSSNPQDFGNITKVINNDNFNTVFKNLNNIINTNTTINSNNNININNYLPTRKDLNFTKSLVDMNNVEKIKNKFNIKKSIGTDNFIRENILRQRKYLVKSNPNPTKMIQEMKNRNMVPIN